jgi:rSAM/selenodomain-associated transferase 1
VSDPAQAPRLAVFAKEPAPGAVKTRLAAAIGAQGAARVYRELTTVTLRHAESARRTGVISDIEIWCAPDSHSPYFRELAATFNVSLHPQCRGDLGMRMAEAIASALTRTPAVLLIGTDCPLLDARSLADAGRILASHDAVLGPAEDGGYVLVGARCPLPFAGVHWSSPRTFEETASGFSRAGIRWAALPVAWDVDDAAGLARWEAIR